MTVRKIIPLIFVVIIGITIATCTASTSKRRGPIEKKTGCKNLENKLLTFTPFSYFGVLRRYLSPSSKFADNLQILNTENNKNDDIEKLKLSVKFRDNILHILSYLLQGLDDGLTEEQYTSVQMLYDVVRKRMVRVYDILPALSELDTTDKNQQTIIVLSSLVKNLPPYLRCTATFLVQEIEENKLDLNILFTPTKVTTFNYLFNIDSSIFRNQPNFDEEMEADDEQSRITRNTLGAVFVGLLHNLHVNKQPLSQELFGLILINLPNPSDDPVLEENIKYLYDVTINNDITPWDSIEEDVASKDAYSAVFFTLSKILAYPSITIAVRNAAIYVYNHLKLVTPTHTNSNFNYMYNLIKQDINIGMLLSAIIPEEFGPDAIRMKDQLLVYFMHNYKNKELNQALRGFNRFAFHDPLDLLMALLTRLQNRIPASNRNVLQPVTALLSTLIMKKHARTFTSFVSPEVDILILLESVKSPDVDPVLSSMIDSLKLELISEPQLSVFLSTLMPVEKSNCLMPRQCLINTLQQVDRLQGYLPLMLIRKIQNVAYTLQSSSVQYQPQYILPQGFDTQYSTVSTNAAVRANAVMVVLEPDNVQTPNVPKLGGSSYVWNIDNYIGGTDYGARRMSDGSAEILESETPANIDSAETKVVTSITTERVQTIKNVPFPTETLSDKSTILTHSPQEEISYTTTQVPQKVVIVSNKSTSSPPTQSTESEITQSKEPEITQSEQSNHATYTTAESTSKESNFEIKYKETSVPVSLKPLSLPKIPILVFEEKKNVTYSTISEFSESPKIKTEKITVLPAHELYTVTITPEYSTLEASEPLTTEEKPQVIENVATKIIFSPSINIDQPLQIQIANNGVPIVTIDDSHNTSVPKLVLPGIKELLKPPNIDHFFENSNALIVTQVLQPLSAIYGKSYIKKILKDVDIKSYFTNIALLTAVLKNAKNLPQVTVNTDLINLIQKYITSIDFISPTILLPIVVSAKKLTANVIYSTFNQQDLIHSKISENPPDENSSDTVTVPLVNPKLLLQPVNSSDPYGDLLPILEEGNIFETTLRPLRAIFTSKEVTEILGPDFQPLAYPNKDALLVTLLRKLRETGTIRSNSELLSLIEMYIHAIEIPAMNSYVSEDNDWMKMKYDTTDYRESELPVDELSHTVTIRPESSPTVEKKPQPTENVVTEITFLPSTEHAQLFQIEISSNGAVVATTNDSHDMPKLFLPEIKELLKPPNIDYFSESRNDNLIVTQVLQPLSAIFGGNYIKKILKEVDIKSYSTNIALLSAILEKAKNLPQITMDTNLTILIQKYITSVDIISPTLLSIVTLAKNLTSNVIYSTFNQQNLTHSEISENPPNVSSSDTVTVPLVNPKLLLQPVNSSDSYGDLLPILEEGDIFETTLRPLRAIFTSEEVVEILGPDFQPLIYPNKGALLIALLRKLRETETIQSNPELKSLIEMYIHAIEIPAINSPVSEENLEKIKFETIDHLQPELHVDEPHTVTTRPEPSPTVEEKPQPVKNVATGIIFPPSIEPDQPLQIQISSNDVPVVTTDDSHDTSVPKLVLPGINKLLKPPNIDNFFEGSDAPVVTQVLQPLSAIFGKNYIKEILQDVDMKSYSTNIALLSAIFEKAKNLPQITIDTNLTNLIQKYITSIDFISPTILLPIVTSAKKLTSNVIYSTFNQHTLAHSEISENPPNVSSSDTVTIPLVNPKLLLQPVNPSNPYDDLLPVLEEGDNFEVALQPLRAIFTSEKIVEIFGPDFQPLIYPNKGALLITLLRKLRKIETIQSNPGLKSLIEIYIQAIEIPAMNSPVSEDNLVNMKSEIAGYWQPELTSLIYLLPTAKNEAEIVKMKSVEDFLSDPNLLEKLQIDKPPSTRSRGELLQQIILNALSGKISLEKRIQKALRYYKNKVQRNSIGALPIIWVWVETYTIKAEVNLGSMIQDTLDFNKLDFDDKLAYNDLVTYLSINPDLLQNNEDFDFEKYKTQGQFIKALLKYLSKKPEIDDKIRQNILQLLPHVSLTGPGAILLPSFFEF